MQARTIFAIARKDALDILLNTTTLVTLLSPIFLAVLFIVLTRLTFSTTTSLLIYNPDGSGVEQVVADVFGKTSVTHAATPNDVAAAFGADGARINTPYALGLVVPPGLDATLRAGGQPQIMLYLNGDSVKEPQRVLLVGALTDYAHRIANPQPPIKLGIVAINPPKVGNPSENVGIFLVMVNLVGSFFVGAGFVASLLVEEKERKTLRMLMVSPASWADVIVGKLLVGLGYQLLLAAAILTIQGGFVGDIPLVLLFVLLGCSMAIALGLLAGSVLQTGSAVGAFVGVIGFVFLVPAILANPFNQGAADSPVAQAMHAVPTYYLADGTLNAMLKQGTLGSIVLDIAVLLGCTLAFVAAAAWSLRRQMTVAGMI
jgi:ABC-2 type transport system permease protein